MKSLKPLMVAVSLILITPSAIAINIGPGGRDGWRDRDGGGSGGSTHVHYRGCGHEGAPQPEAIPEIDSGSIGLAIGIVGGLLAFAVERRRKAPKET